ncbi:hypothetical protein B0O80DRAFT_456691 [Mortierella sp. GBAus27b]|nr:hypothetical protein B0O80DRAFT_456691 [Mortierella sp. GBAus27b]
MVACRRGLSGDSHGVPCSARDKTSNVSSSRRLSSDSNASWNVSIFLGAAEDQSLRLPTTRPNLLDAARSCSGDCCLGEAPRSTPTSCDKTSWDNDPICSPHSSPVASSDVEE